MRKKRLEILRSAGLLLLFFLVATTLYAQSLSDIQNIKVDNLSDSQIQQLIQRAESSGMTQAQLEAFARERGMPAGEINKLRQRIMSLQGGSKSQQAGKAGAHVTGRTMPQFGIEQNVFDSLNKSDPYYDLTPTQKKIFGYKLFHNRELNFSPSLNIPTPRNYVIGTDDQLLIDVYGASEQSYDLNVNPEGRVLIPNVGPIQVGGSTIEAAEARIKTAMSRIYSGMSGSNPNTFIQIRLGNIRSIKVSMVGELNKPGTYTLPSFASVFNALYAAGGPNENGSFRHIQVYRENRMVSEVDIYEFLTKGESSANIGLRDNDVVIVQPLKARVEVTGPVRREGLFEMKPDENMDDLLMYTGGFQSKAFTDRVTVRRIEGNERKVLDISQADYGSYSARDGDEIQIGEILDRFANRVQVTGAVIRPGEYTLTSTSMGIKELLERAVGLKEDAFPTRATLYRTGADLTLEATSVDLKGILEGSAADIPLKNEDLLHIPSRFDIREEFYVKISGEIGRPGTYPFATNMTVGDLILRSRGLLESASNASIEIARRVKNDRSGKIAEILLVQVDENLRITEEERNIPLMPFDHVFIRSSPGFQREKIVTVEGEVLSGGDFALAGANERISDLIKRSGGLTQFAYPKGATLIRRTEYFKSKTEKEVKQENIEELFRNLDPEENRTTNQAEEIVYKRLEKRLLKAEQEKLEAEQKLEEELEKQRLVSSIRADRLSHLSPKDTTLQNVEQNEQELVGIDLEAILKNPGSAQDLILMEGDVISVPKELQTVRMRGQVLFPTTARYIPNKGARSFVSKAGGFTDQARRSKTYVVYANGDVKRTQSFLFFKFYPNVEPGAEIIVPQKPNRPPMSVQAWVGLASSLATLAILIDRVAR